MPFLDAGRRLSKLQLKSLSEEDQTLLNAWAKELEEWLQVIVVAMNTNAGAPEVLDEGSSVLPDAAEAEGRFYYDQNGGLLKFSLGATGGWKTVTLV